LVFATFACDDLHRAGANTADSASLRYDAIAEWYDLFLLGTNDATAAPLMWTYDIDSEIRG